MWPGFDPRSRRHMWGEFVGSRSFSEGFPPGFFLGPLVSPPSSKSNISKFQFDLKSGTHGFVSRKTARLFSVTFVKQSQFIYLK